MRLPGYQNRPVETLARYDVSGPAREWAAETRAMQAAVGTVSAIGDLVRKVDEVKQKEAARERAFEVRRRYMTARDRLLTTEAYDLNDPEQVDFLGSSLDGFDLRDGQGGMRSTVRKDEIISRAWESKRDQILKDGMEGMTPFQQKLIDNELRYEIFGIDNGIRKEQLLSTNDYMRTSAINVADGLAKEGNLVGAIEAIQDTEQFTEEEKRDIVQGLRKRTEIERYAEALMSEDEAKLQSQMRTLSDPEYAGTLSSSERMTYWARTKRILDKKEADRQSAMKVDTRMLTYGAKESIKALYKGMPVTDDMPRQVAALRAAGRDVEAEQLINAMSHSMILSEVSHLPISEQDAFLAVIRENATTPEEFNTLASVEKALKFQRREMARDTVQYALDSDNYEIDPIEWGSEDIGDQLKKRQNDMLKINVQTGKVSNLLSDQEVAEFNAQMQEASPEQFQGMVNTINQSFGKQAPKVWNQLQVKFGNTRSKAGEVANYEIAGSEQIADSIVKAQAMMQEAPEMVKAQDKKMKKNPQYLEVFGLYPPGNAQKSITESIRARYYYNAFMSGQTEFNSELYEKSAEEVTGGLLNLNGRTIEAPVPGMSQDDLDTFIDNMTPGYIEAIGMPSRLSGYDIANAMRDGDIIVIPVGRNQYGLAWKNAPNIAIGDMRGGAFRFFYNEELAQEKIFNQERASSWTDWLLP